MRTIKSAAATLAFAAALGTIGAASASAATVPAGERAVNSTPVITSSVAPGATAASTGRPYTYLSDVQQVAGANRFATAVALANKAYPAGTTSVVLVNGNGDAVDALSAGPLARATKAALLLTEKDSLPAETRDFIVKNKVTNVTIVGGAPSVSLRVAEQLRELGIKSADLTRIAGTDRYETSLLVAKNAAFASGQRVYLAGGNSAPDAVSAGGVAGATNAPVVLVGTDANAIEADYRYDFIRNRPEIVALGSSKSVSDDVARVLSANVRLGGVDRYETSLKIAQYAAGTGVNLEEVVVATAEGTNVVDALAAANLGEMVVLTPKAGWTDNVHTFLYQIGAKNVVTAGAQTPTK